MKFLLYEQTDSETVTKRRSNGHNIFALARKDGARGAFGRYLSDNQYLTPERARALGRGSYYTVKQILKRLPDDRRLLSGFFGFARTDDARDVFGQ